MNPMYTQAPRSAWGHASLEYMFSTIVIDACRRWLYCRIPSCDLLPKSEIPNTRFLKPVQKSKIVWVLLFSLRFASVSMRICNSRYGVSSEAVSNVLAS